MACWKTPGICGIDKTTSSALCIVESSNFDRDTSSIAQLRVFVIRMPTSDEIVPVTRPMAVRLALTLLTTQVLMDLLKGLFRGTQGSHGQLLLASASTQDHLLLQEAIPQTRNC